MTEEQEVKYLKSVLYGTTRTCDNCGYTGCENFQRQRKKYPCKMHMTFQERIQELEKEIIDRLKEKYNKE